MPGNDQTNAALGTARSAAAQIFIHSFPLMVAEAVRRCHPLAFHQFQLLNEESAILAPGLDDDDPRLVASSAWIDLAAEPVVLRLPPARGRYLSLTLIDATGEPFTSLGSRTEDDNGIDLALVGPNWRGELPSGLTARRAPTEGVWALSRIYAHSTVDRAEALSIARRQCIALLRQEVLWPRPSLPLLEAPVASCVRQVFELTADLFFHRLDSVLDRAPVAHQRATRLSLATPRAQLGGPQETLAWSPEFSQVLDEGLADGAAAIRAAADSSRSEGLGWRAVGSRVNGASANALTRAARAYVGLGAPTRDDVLSLICDRDEGGRPLSGADNYRIHFPPDGLPPVDAFWSMSPQPAPSGAHRVSLGDRSDLSQNRDGSVDILMQPKTPEPDHLLNWLPEPEGRFQLVAKLYWPREEALSGAWRMPLVERLGSGASRRLRSSQSTQPPFRIPPMSDLNSSPLAWRASP